MLVRSFNWYHENLSGLRHGALLVFEQFFHFGNFPDGQFLGDENHMAGWALRQLGGDIVSQVLCQNGSGHQLLITTGASPDKVFGFDVVCRHLLFSLLKAYSKPVPAKYLFDGNSMLSNRL
jgi:hypothetical protein